MMFECGWNNVYLVHVCHLEEHYLISPHPNQQLALYILPTVARSSAGHHPERKDG